MARAKKSDQGSFKFVGWGGKRRGAGRKARGRPSVAHSSREKRSGAVVAHVTLRFVAGLPNLRELAHFTVVLSAIVASAFGLFFRIVEFSVQRNHIHLLIEAVDMEATTLGLKSLEARISRSLNRHLGRKGRVIGDRYHFHRIETPREARNALAYLLNNARKHALEAGVPLPTGWVDPRSSGPWFSEWSDADPAHLRRAARPVPAPRSWLLRVGWRKAGATISTDELPGRSRKKSPAMDAELTAST